MNVVRTANAPTPAGHYSQGIVANGFVFVAGQLPMEQGVPADPSMPIERQVEIAIGNVAAILGAAGSSLANVVSITVYITDVSLWPRVNAAYAKALGDHRPARTTVPVPALHHGWGVEVQAIATVAATPVG